MNVFFGAFDTCTCINRALVQTVHLRGRRNMWCRTSFTSTQVTALFRLFLCVSQSLVNCTVIRSRFTLLSLSSRLGLEPGFRSLAKWPLLISDKLKRRACGRADAWLSQANFGSLLGCLGRRWRAVSARHQPGRGNAPRYRTPMVRWCVDMTPLLAGGERSWRVDVARFARAIDRGAVARPDVEVPRCRGTST